MVRLGRTVAMRRLGSALIALAFIFGLSSLGTQTGVDAADPPQVGLEKILSGYDLPLLVTGAGDGTRDIYIVEQEGKIKRAVFRNGAWRKRGVFLDISHLVIGPASGRPDQGLLSLAFHPRYERNGRFFVYYTRDAVGSAVGDTVVAEYRRLWRGKADPRSRRRIMVIDQPSMGHNGGHLAFGPDRLLYLSTGDGDFPADPNEAGQDPSSPLGKLLRFSPTDPDGRGPRRLTIPRSNPFVGIRGKRSDVWSMGLRHPWRFSFDRKTGALWIGDVGELDREEIDRAAADRRGRGAGRAVNYGWDDCEGTREFELDEGDADTTCETHTLPIYDYRHDRERGWCAVTGGHVHRGPDAPQWRGLYVAGDWCGRLFVLGRSGDVRFSTNSGMHITSFGEDSDGRILAASGEGEIHLVVFSGPRP